MPPVLLVRRPAVRDHGAPAGTGGRFVKVAGHSRGDFYECPLAGGRAVVRSVKLGDDLAGQALQRPPKARPGRPRGERPHPRIARVALGRRPPASASAQRRPGGAKAIGMDARRGEPDLKWSGSMRSATARARRRWRRASSELAVRPTRANPPRLRTGDDVDAQTSPTGIGMPVSPLSARTMRPPVTASTAAPGNASMYAFAARAPSSVSGNSAKMTNWRPIVLK